MIQVEKSIIIHCPVEQVFAFVTALNNGARWQSGTIEERKITPGPVSKGTTFYNVSMLLGRRIESTLQITELIPNQKFCFHSVSALVPSQMEHIYEAVDGGTRLTVRAQGEIDGFFKIAELLVTRQAEQKVETDLTNLKQLLEDGG
jgi:uncharacterized membrane protein